MNWLDIVLIVVIVAGFIKGYRDGLIRQIVFFFALIAAIYLCSSVAVNMRIYMLQTDWFHESTVTILSYIFAFIMIAGIVTFAGWIIHKMISVTPLSILNHLAGALFGLIITILLLSLTLNFIDGFDRRSALISQKMKSDSHLYYIVKDIILEISPVNLFIIHEEVEKGVVI
jgi:Uncharacterized membrane protein, required for colicin V production